MNLKSLTLCFSICILRLLPQAKSTTDADRLLAFKSLVTNDPLSVFTGFNRKTHKPCSWHGVTCAVTNKTGKMAVESLVLSGKRLHGYLSDELGRFPNLKHLDLSNNFFAGSLPSTIFNSPELETLSVSGNNISGELPYIFTGLKKLKVLNLSYNVLAGNVPVTFASMQSLRVLSLRSNFFSGTLPTGFRAIEFIDLSSNLLNGSLPLDFGGKILKKMNLSRNKLSGFIPQDFAINFQERFTVIDLSFNDLAGTIPASRSLRRQNPESFMGNQYLCGQPLNKTCSSGPSAAPNATPAIAVLPRSIESSPSTNTEVARSGINSSTVAAIVVADVAALAVISMVILYLYQINIQKVIRQQQPHEGQESEEQKKQNAISCLSRRESTESTSENYDTRRFDGGAAFQDRTSGNDDGKLVMIDKGMNLSADTLMSASASVLGSGGAGTVYRVSIIDGATFAVRRLGETSVKRRKDFERRVKLIGNLQHPNLIRVRAFFWRDDEQLLVYDYAANGSLADLINRKLNSSSLGNLSLEIRIKIAKGIARGLAFVHEKKHVHGSIKPRNVLLSVDMEPLIADFGLRGLVSGNLGRASSSGSFGDDRHVSPYRAPESSHAQDPSPEWDMYSFGVILLELLTGRIVREQEVHRWTCCNVVEYEQWISRLADVAVRDDVEARKDVFFEIFNLGFCCSSSMPKKRYSMRDSLLVLEKF